MIFLVVEDLFDVIEKRLPSVTNKKFIDAFKDQFRRETLSLNKHNLKDVRNCHNPLVRLLKINKQQKGQSVLLQSLIVLTTSLIDINECDIKNDTFDHPSRNTFTYNVLFNQTLKSVPIHKRIIDTLSAQLKKWEEGVLANDVRTWKNLNPDAKTVIREIWTLISQILEQDYQFEALFDKTYQDMRDKLATNEKVLTCINLYCQQADDKDEYLTQVRDCNRRFEHEYVKSIKIPSPLTDIGPLALKLNPYSEVSAWRAFLQQRTSSDGKI